jgi:hypothetical protein
MPFTDGTPLPSELWEQARSEHPTDVDGRRRRYQELLREHGQLIAGKHEPLPCGWEPGRPNG